MARVLPPESGSVREARRLVRTLLDDTPLASASEDAELAISEIVTNALVHAGGEVRLAIALTPSGLRVDVADASAHLPVRRDYSTASGTGRGLLLVDDVTTRWGAARQGSGKVVWFEIEDPRGAPFDEAAPDGDPQPAPDDVLVVDLRNVPLLMHAAWQEHTAALLRELLLALIDDDPDVLERHARASDAMNVLHEQIPSPELGTAPEMVMSEAVEPRVSAEAIALRVPRGSVEHFAVLDAMVREALEEAGPRRLLVPPTQPEVRQMSQWMCQEVLEQSQAPRAGRPWSAPVPDHVPGPDAVDLDGWSASEVSDSPLAVLATDETSVIVAVSATALEVLGYERAPDLVGRPLTCIVPARFHQAHIAGTTLHVINGRDPLLGRPLTVPVVLADGTEAERSLTVESRMLPNGERLFLAEFHAD